MAATIEYYHGNSTYIIYAEETVFGTPGTPTIANFVGRITSASVEMGNNYLLSQGIGEGRNVTQTVLGPFSVTGSINWEINDFTFVQYMIGDLAGVLGTVADPFELQERRNIGYTSGTDIPTITLEFGSEGDTQDQVLQVDGVVFKSFTLNASEGGLLNASCSWVGRNATRSTVLETYTAPTQRTFVFQQGTFELGNVGDPEAMEIRSFSLTLNNNTNIHRAIGSRFIQRQSLGKRRYTFNVTFKKKYDDTASTKNPTALLGAANPEVSFFNAANTPLTTGTPITAVMNLDLSEGGASTQREVRIELENVFFDSWSESIILGEVVEVTVSGHAHSGLADGAQNVPIRWWTIA
ncbi:hypothetical protein A2415_04485 [candidate division WWE3 bacterium RIFOXYC1_FULL_39_7]|uniref:Uncharacterized protein n=1 Tax=candidate division WWE3 bacterium RIFOXYC1_FULL_39_7 TaxID=1802643 RepID=A0A1F4WFX9_UNCKA|nr:MAG: hypothetical protein A2415_04485 [candidate division WWE3 bacterium RIFOXYC1_FULL_39_7]